MLHRSAGSRATPLLGRALRSPLLARRAVLGYSAKQVFKFLFLISSRNLSSSLHFRWLNQCGLLMNVIVDYK